MPSGGEIGDPGPAPASDCAPGTRVRPACPKGHQDAREEGAMQIVQAMGPSRSRKACGQLLLSDSPLPTLLPEAPLPDRRAD